VRPARRRALEGSSWKPGPTSAPVVVRNRNIRHDWEQFVVRVYKVALKLPQVKPFHARAT
jgi:hypothetical protein